MPEELKTLHVRITARKGKQSYSYTESVDLEDEREMWEEWTTNGANPQLERFTFEQYHSPLKINQTEVALFNGNHFIFGFMECLGQGENCPPFLREINDEETVEVIWNADL